MAEMQKEYQGILGPHPPTPEELAKVQASETLSLPGSRETIEEVGGSIGELVEYGLPDDYYDKYAGRVRALQLADIETIAKRLVQPDHVIWLVIGDRAKIETGVRGLKLGEVKFLDADGKPI
jgi:zinc protease